jgi:monoamine oxidase
VAVRFSPKLPEKEDAANALEMGNAFRIVLRFRERFWEKLDLPDKRGNANLWDLGFLHSRDEKIPTWWTQLPVRTPLLVGWAGGPVADQLCSMGRDELISVAIESLSNILRIGRDRILDQFVKAHFHNWADDPFSRGAYSYVPVNGLAVQRKLAEPVAGTLFFAGEATNTEGHLGTVHGAIATGYRAAREILAESSQGAVLTES